MAVFRFLFAPALLAVAVVAGHGERHRPPRPPAPAAARLVPAPAAIEPAGPNSAAAQGAVLRRARTPR
ncbi:MAG TPA: hypothetical protein VIV57_11800 [Anaeromyxobacter sp.]